MEGELGLCFLIDGEIEGEKLYAVVVDNLVHIKVTLARNTDEVPIRFRPIVPATETRTVAIISIDVWKSISEAL